MKRFFHRTAAVLLIAFVLAGLSPHLDVFAQPTSAPSSPALSEATIRSLQEALGKQGFPVTINGVLNDETRAAIRKYQSAHHLSVTGEADKATLDKLGVRVSGAAGQPTTTAQTVPETVTPQSPMQPGQMMQGGMMMNCPMMQGQMEEMMKMMKGMMTMMAMMQKMMGPMPMQPGQMPPEGK